MNYRTTHPPPWFRYVGLVSTMAAVVDRWGLRLWTGTAVAPAWWPRGRTVVAYLLFVAARLQPRRPCVLMWYRRCCDRELRAACLWVVCGPGAPSITWRCGFGILVGGVGVCARGWARREDVGLDTLSELNESVGHLVRVRVSGLSKTASVGCRSVFLDPDVGEDLGHLRGGCVVVSAGGASGGIIFACMQCCIHCCKTGSVCWTMLVVLLVPATRCWPVVSQCLPSLSQRLGSRVAQVSIRPGRDMLLVLRGVQQDRCPSSWPPCLQPLGTGLEFVMAERQYDV